MCYNNHVSKQIGDKTMTENFKDVCPYTSINTDVSNMTASEVNAHLDNKCSGCVRYYQCNKVAELDDRLKEIEDEERDTHKEVKYNTIVGVDTHDELVILEYTFKQGALKGATGYKMTVLTEGEIEYRSTLEYNEDIVKEIWKEAVRTDKTEYGLEDFFEYNIQQNLNSDELYPFDDPSFRLQTENMYECLSDEDREAVENILGVYGEDYVTFTCTSCGRIFSKDITEADFKVIIRPDLLEVIKKVEEE